MHYKKITISENYKNTDNVILYSISNATKISFPFFYINLFLKICFKININHNNSNFTNGFFIFIGFKIIFLQSVSLKLTFSPLVCEKASNTSVERDLFIIALQKQQLPSILILLIDKFLTFWWKQTTFKLIIFSSYGMKCLRLISCFKL